MKYIKFFESYQNSFLDELKKRVPALKDFLDLSTDNYINLQKTIENKNVRLYIPKSDLTFILPIFDIIITINCEPEKFYFNFNINFDIEYPDNIDQEFKKHFQELAFDISKTYTLTLATEGSHVSLKEYIINHLNKTFFELPDIINKYLFIPDIDAQFD